MNRHRPDSIESGPRPGHPAPPRARGRLFPPRGTAVLAALVLIGTACSEPGGEPASASSSRPLTTATTRPVPAAQPGDRVDACLDDPPAPPSGIALLQPVHMAEPEVRIPFLDPVFGTCQVRVTDRHRDLPGDDPSAGLKNEYSRVQSFNADDSLILVRSIEGAFYLYDAATLESLGRVPVEVEPRWDPQDPDRLYFVDETRLMAFDVADGAVRETHEFADDLPDRSVTIVWTRYEGSPSADGRYWGLMAEDEDWRPAALLVYDRSEDRVVAIRDLTDLKKKQREIDSVTISPSGEWFLAYHDAHCKRGQLGTYADPCGLMVYDRGLQDARGLVRIIGHSDLALDAAGRDVLVFQDIDRDEIAMLDLETGAVTPLWPIDFSRTAIGLHFSGRSYHRPGWVVVSTYGGGNPRQFTWMDDQVFAIELKPGGRVVRLAHTHSVVDEDMEHDYWAEPHATANRDLTRILFTSNWGRSGTEEVEMYQIVLPADWS